MENISLAIEKTKSGVFVTLCLKWEMWTIRRTEKCLPRILEFQHCKGHQKLYEITKLIILIRTFKVERTQGWYEFEAPIIFLSKEMSTYSLKIGMVFKILIFNKSAF